MALRHRAWNIVLILFLIGTAFAQAATLNESHSSNAARLQFGRRHGKSVFTERRRVTARFTVLNLTDKVALYNFLSTFSGTHFLAPRTFEAAIGFVF